MTFALFILGMLVYSVGVLTGVYVGYKMARELATRAKDKK